MTSIGISYWEDPKSLRRLRFALSLAHRLDAKLRVRLVVHSENILLARKLRPEIDHNMLVRAMIESWTARGLDTNGTVLDFDFSNKPRTETLDLHLSTGQSLTLYPGQSSGLPDRGKVCVPFGNSDPAAVALDGAASLLSTLGYGVIFYHTSWRKGGLSPHAAPDEHMTDGATAIRQQLEQCCADLKLPCSVKIETADGVFEGALRFALVAGCQLILLSRGERTLRGSYVDQFLVDPLLPVLVVKRGEA